LAVSRKPIRGGLEAWFNWLGVDYLNDFYREVMVIDVFFVFSDEFLKR